MKRPTREQVEKFMAAGYIVLVVLTLWVAFQPNQDPAEAYMRQAMRLDADIRAFQAETERRGRELDERLGQMGRKLGGR